MGKREKISLAGWSTREFTGHEIQSYLYRSNPKIFEVSKDIFNDRVSIKDLYKMITKYKRNHNILISYAGTTDFCNCSNLDFSQYIKYLQIQIAQAKFLKAKYFRILIGGSKSYPPNIVINRLGVFSKAIEPIKPLIEIHSGWESSLNNIRQIINNTHYDFVIDFQNILRLGLSFSEIKVILKPKRIAYCHSRNIPPMYIEDIKSAKEQKRWINYTINKAILWEPKKLLKSNILRIYNEY